MKSAAILLLVLASLVSHDAPAQTQRAPQALRLRAEPSPIARVVARVPAGAAVQVNGCSYVNSTWCSVTYQGTRGYIAAARLAEDGSVPAVRRTPRSGETSTGGTPSTPSRRYERGSRGGCYYLSDSGRKVYVDHAFCGGSAQGLVSESPSSTRARTSTTSSGSARSSGSERSYTRGPRGGCYYLSGSGRKVYVDHSFCN
jgi:uncharacterized protein YraI